MAIAQSLLDDLWDFSDPAGSEQRLRARRRRRRMPRARAELDTQVARSLGLQERYDEADAVLDGIRSPSEAAAVRIALERGRLRNSGGDPRQPCRCSAPRRRRRQARTSCSCGSTRCTCSRSPIAAHAGEWTARALAVLDGTTDPRTQRWRVSLHNNAGWTHFDAERYDEAVTEFEASRDAATRWGTPQQVAWADEAIAEARAPRSSERGVEPGVLSRRRG